MSERSEKDDEPGLLLLDEVERDGSSPIVGVLVESMSELRGFSIGPSGTAVGVGKAAPGPAKATRERKLSAEKIAEIQEMVAELDGKHAPRADAPSPAAPAVPPPLTDAEGGQVATGPSIRDTIEDHDVPKIVAERVAASAPMNDTDPASPSARDARAARLAVTSPAMPRNDPSDDARRLARVEAEPVEETKTDGRRLVPTMVVPTVVQARRARNGRRWALAGAASVAVLGLAAWALVHRGAASDADQASAVVPMPTVAPVASYVVPLATVVAPATSTVRAATSVGAAPRASSTRPAPRTPRRASTPAVSGSAPAPSADPRIERDENYRLGQ